MDKSKRQARLDRKKAEKRQGQRRWLLITIVAAVGVTALLIISGQVRAPSVEHSYTEKNGDQLGDPEAAVTIIEYGDFQCSHCLNFFNTTESLLITNHVETGEAFYEYRAVGFLGPESILAAEAAYCAADQNMFWEYHDVVFSNYSTGNSGGYDEGRLVEFAETLEMDQEAFAACLSSGEKADQVEANRAAAAADGVTGTPGFIVNGTVLEGNRPYSDFETIIAAAIGNN